MTVERQQQTNGSPTWFLQAACRGMDPAIFFPENDPGPGEALAVCAVCPVRQPCLEDAYQNNDTGVRGGTTWSWRRRHYHQVQLLARCKHCRAEFTPPTRLHLYCSDTCRRFAHSLRAAEAYRAKVGQA